MLSVSNELSARPFPICAGHCGLCKKMVLSFLSFPYVCPEPVLANDHLYTETTDKKDRFLTCVIAAMSSDLSTSPSPSISKGVEKRPFV